MVLVGNKCDLTESREVPTEEGRALAGATGCPFFESSAKTRVNVEEVFVAVVREIKRLKERNSPSVNVNEGRRRGSCLLL
jgi:GTPase SAR1 family protein